MNRDSDRVSVETPVADEPSREVSVHEGVTVEIRDLTLTIGDQLLLEDTSARFEAGEVTLIVGPSGAGKSTLLRLLAGLVDHDDGVVTYSGELLLAGRKVTSASLGGHVGVVFQDYALFDELSPGDNVRLAQSHRPRRESHSQLATNRELLDELGVPGYVRTASLSGGQRQRLAIARTLAFDPDVIAYDEPTSGLDAATAANVASLIRSTHSKHPKTSIVVTHDYESLAPIADRIYLLDSRTCSLREVPRHEWSRLRDQLKPAGSESAELAEVARDGIADRLRTWQGAVGRRLGDFFAGTSRVLEQTFLLPWWLLPAWRSPRWGFRFLAHYLRLVAGPSAWAYIGIAGLIIGFVATYFTFRFLPYSHYTKPLLIEDLLMAMGFALYRILVPILSSILIAARCGAAVASDIGNKSYGRQMDALRTLGAKPRPYLLTPILYSFLVGTPLLTAWGYLVASATSLATFVATHPDRGPDFWNLHYHSRLSDPQHMFYLGSGWLLAKTLTCAAGIALIAYNRGARKQHSGRDVSHSITSTILWSTLFVLIVHFVFAFVEFE